MSSLASKVSRRFALAALSGLALAVVAPKVSFAQSGDAVRVVKIATAAESQPLSWGAIGVEPEGYEPDLWREINKRLPQYKFEMEGAADIAQETGLVTGKYDAISGGYYWSEARAEQFLIPDNPTGASLMKIYSRKDSGINEMKDLVGKRIVPVSAGGGVYKFTTKWLEENPGHAIEITASSAGIPYPDRLKEVNNGKFDALILPSNLGEQEVIKNQGLDIVESEPVAINNTYFLFHRSDENKALVEDVNRVLKELREDGTLDALSVKWFGGEVSKYIQ
mgnify:CR=1 FL=1